MKNKVLDNESLEEMFGLTDISDGVIEDEYADEVVVVEPIEPDGDDNDYIDDELRGLICTCKEMMDAAKYLISAAPDAEAIQASASLISSLGSIMSEFNKAILMKKKFNEMTKLEKMKIKARKELVHLRSQLDARKLQIGDGNTFVQNNLVAYNQEDVVAQIAAEEQARKDQN
jgi:hypothetical protein